MFLLIIMRSAFGYLIFLYNLLIYNLSGDQMLVKKKKRFDRLAGIVIEPKRHLKM